MNASAKNLFAKLIVLAALGFFPLRGAAASAAAETPSPLHSAVQSFLTSAYFSSHIMSDSLKWVGQLQSNSAGRLQTHFALNPSMADSFVSALKELDFSPPEFIVQYRPGASEDQDRRMEELLELAATRRQEIARRENAMWLGRLNATPPREFAIAYASEFQSYVNDNLGYLPRGQRAEMAARNLRVDADVKRRAREITEHVAAFNAAQRTAFAAFHLSVADGIPKEIFVHEDGRWRIAIEAPHFVKINDEALGAKVSQMKPVDYGSLRDAMESLVNALRRTSAADSGPGAVETMDAVEKFLGTDAARQELSEAVIAAIKEEFDQTRREIDDARTSPEKLRLSLANRKLRQYKLARFAWTPSADKFEDAFRAERNRLASDRSSFANYPLDPLREWITSRAEYLITTRSEADGLIVGATLSELADRANNFYTRAERVWNFARGTTLAVGAVLCAPLILAYLFDDTNTIPSSPALTYLVNHGGIALLGAAALTPVYVIAVKVAAFYSRTRATLTSIRDLLPSVSPDTKN